MPEMTLQQAFDMAVAHHNAGRLGEAESVYRQILVYQPEHVDAMRMLARIEHQRGNFAGAEHMLRQAIALRSGVADYHANLGMVLATGGKADAAIESLGKAIALNPSIPEVYLNLGNVLGNKGDLDGALEAYHKAVTLRPNYFDALFSFGRALLAKSLNGDAVEACSRAVALRPEDPDAQFDLGKALFALGQFERALSAFNNVLALRPSDPAALVGVAEAQRCLGRMPDAISGLRRAVDLNPNDPELHYRLGHALYQEGPSDECIAALERAVQLRPAYPDALDSLGVALSQRGRLEEALAASRKAMALCPDSAIFENNLGTVLQKCELPEEAVGHYRRALELSKDYPEAQNNIGSALWDSGQLEEGRKELARALELQPDYAAIKANLGMMMLTLGDFENGWPTYEARAKIVPVSLDNHPSPIWDGAPLEGRTIVIQAEQGFGDTIHFARYLQMVADGGGKVVLHCQPELKRLMSCVQGVDRVVGPGEVFPPFHMRSRLMSLPGIFKSNLETIPSKVPYVLPSATDAAHWHERILSLEVEACESIASSLAPASALFAPLKVGLAWAGSAEHPHDKLRSVALAELAGLGEVSGVQFFSLQKGAPAKQLEDASQGMRIIDWTAELQDFADTAALIQNLDLVISIDSAVAHLAGALGIRTWTLIQFVPDWRWLIDRTDSPWYPTMKLYRQRARCGWSQPIAQVKDDLTQLAACRYVAE
jgi:tetratricopeptide (TPR) repeat protein